MVWYEQDPFKTEQLANALHDTFDDIGSSVGRLFDSDEGEGGDPLFTRDLFSGDAVSDVFGRIGGAFTAGSSEVGDHIRRPGRNRRRSSSSRQRSGVPAYRSSPDLQSPADRQRGAVRDAREKHARNLQPPSLLESIIGDASSRSGSSGPLTYELSRGGGHPATGSGGSYVDSVIEGSGSGGGMDQPADPTAGMPDPFDIIAEAQGQVGGLMDQVDSQYDQQLEQLRDMYEFAETPREKAQIQYMLDDLDARKEAGDAAIEKSFQDSIASGLQQAEEMRGQASEAGERMGSLFEGAGADTQQSMERLSQGFADSGTGVGSGTAGLPDVATDWGESLQAAAPREQQATEGAFNLGAQDVEYLSSMLEGEQSAQRAQLQRQAAQMQSQAQMDHNARVSERIGKERRGYANQAGNMLNQRNSRVAGLQDQLLGMGTQQAEMAQRERENERDRQHDLDTILQEAAARIRQIEAEKEAEAAQANQLGGTN